MRRHPGSGWRGRCVLIAGGLMGYAAAPLPVIRAGELTTQPPVLSVPTPRRPAAPTPRPQPARPATSPTPAAMQATPHADVLSSPKQLEQLGRLVEARRAYEAVLVKYPQHVECLHRLGVVCTRLNDFDAARSHYDRALAISP